jgi:hypothetical protein
MSPGMCPVPSQILEQVQMRVNHAFLATRDAATSVQEARADL